MTVKPVQWRTQTLEKKIRAPHHQVKNYLIL